MSRLSPEKESELGNLVQTRYEITSAETLDGDYNCIAWAAGRCDNAWWPMMGLTSYFWPLPVTSNAETVEIFIEAFRETLGYQNCDNPRLEPNVEKVAIFAVNNVVTHMARQLQDGRWTSKCGDWEDITHDLEAVSCGSNPGYGKVACILARPREQQSLQCLFPEEHKHTSFF